ncbi:MAG: ChrR family anti-sigma-E factor [Alphaproteobacteria bacterium]
MSATHHPSDVLIAAYAAGTLPEAQALIVATHGALCPLCRARTRAFEAIGGEVLDGAAPLALSAGAAERALGRLRSAAPDIVPPPAPVSDLPRPLADYVPGGYEALRWRRHGARIATAPVATSRDDGLSAFILRVHPGSSVPRHGHRGVELTLVLAGSYMDELGRFARGDLEEIDGNVEHHPVAGPDGDCICLVVTEGKLRLRGVLARLVQRLTGI